MQVAPLQPARTEAVRRMLLEAPDTNLYMLGALAGGGLANHEGVTWWGASRDGQLAAVVWQGRPQPDPGARRAAGLVVPWGEDEACAAVGRRIALEGPPELVIGPREASDALWRGMGDPPARIWYAQRLYVCTAVQAGPTLAMRPARADELPMVIEMSAAMMREDLGADPRLADPDGFPRKMQARVLGGRVLLGLLGEEVVFKVDIGTRTAQGVQVGGTFVVPRYRGRGLGTAGMRAACARLQAQSPRVSLHVNEANTPAVRAYEAAGFRRDAPFRLASRELGG